MVITGTKRGQVTLVNLLALMVVLFVFFVFLPIINSMSDTAIASLEAAPNDCTPYYAALIRFIPLAVIVSIILTGINYAIPRREGVGY